MDDNVFDSIVEITKKQDSDDFSTSVVATIAEIIPRCLVSLFSWNAHPENHYNNIATLSSQFDEKGVKRYKWDVELPIETQEYIDTHHDSLLEFSCYRTLDGNYHVFIPLSIDNNVAYAVDVASQDDFSELHATLLAITRVCQNFYAILASSEKDGLTGLFNRKTFDMKLASLLTKQKQVSDAQETNDNNSRITSHPSCSWLAVIDIDFFKMVNDKFGHVYGDEVLLVLSQLMQRTFRANDLLFRFGGEEFIIIFEPIDQQQAAGVLEKFRLSIEKHIFPMIGNITISCGYAQISDTDHPKTVFDKADKALYFAKENGRNRVCNYEMLISENLIENLKEEGDIELF